MASTSLYDSPRASLLDATLILGPSSAAEGNGRVLRRTAKNYFNLLLLKFSDEVLAVPLSLVNFLSSPGDGCRACVVWGVE